MCQKVLIICTSPRKGGNSQRLADEFECGAIMAGHQVEKVNFYDLKLNFCQGCMSCKRTGRCLLEDDGNMLIQKMKESEVIVFTTPVYFYEMCAQLKTVLDRTHPLTVSEYAFTDIYLLTTAGAGSSMAMDATVQGVVNWTTCFPRVRLAGEVRATALLGIQAIEKNARNRSLLKEAYELGKQV